MDLSVYTIAKDVIIALVSVLATYLLTLRIERKKAQAERATEHAHLAAERAKTARIACQTLKELLAEWYTAIGEATRWADSPATTLAQLRTVYEAERFEPKVGNQLLLLEHEPLCRELIATTGIFSRRVFESKGALGMALNAGKYGRDYERYREEALHDLKEYYKTFEQELDRVVRLLKEKEDQIG